MIKCNIVRPVSIVFSILMSFFFISTSSAQNIEKDSIAASNLLIKAIVLTEKEHYKASNTLALQASERFRKLNLWTAWYDSYYQIFDNGYYSNNYKSAIALLEKSLEDIPENQPLIKAKIYKLLGYSYNETGAIFLSDKAYESSISIFKLTDHKEDLNVLYNNRGIYYTQTGDYTKAILYLKAAISYFKSVSNDEYLQNGLLNIGDAYFYNANYIKAKEAYNKAQHIKDLKDGTFELYAAKIHYELKHYDKALIAVKEAIRLSTRCKKDPKEDSYLYYCKENLEDAEKLLGEIYLGLEQPQKALKQFKTILPNYSNSPNKRELGKLYILIGDAQKQLKQYDDALATYQKTLQAFLPQFKKENPKYNPKERLWSLEIWLMEIFKNKGDCFIEKYNSSNKIKWLYLAEENYELVQVFIEKTKLNYTEKESKFTHNNNTHYYFEAILKTKLLLSKLTKSKHYIEEAFMAVQKANAFVLREYLNEKEALEIVGISKDTIDLLNSYQKKINSLRQSISESNAITADSLENIQFEYKQKQLDLKLSIANKHPNYNTLIHNLEGVTVQQIQLKIDSNALFLKYVLGTHNLYVFSITKNQFHIDTIALPKNFNTLVRNYRQSISDLTFIKNKPELAEKQYLNSAFKLYKLLLERTLKRYSDNNTILKLSIVADGVLNTIPFQALLHKKSSSWTDSKNALISKYAIHYNYFSKMILEQTANNKHTNFMSFGLEFDDYTLEYLKGISQDSITNETLKEALRSGTFSKLPFSDDEAKALAQLMNGKSWLNNQASKFNFLKNAPKAGIIHLATHSILNKENPNLSSLVFIKTKDSTDNMLRLDAIYSLKLKASMITLSACSTGFGKNQKGEGINSLARAFNFSGISNVTATLWNIPDEASKKIMVLYYNYLKQGNTKAFALQKAQLDYLQSDAISSPAFRLPIYWASWVTIGDNTSVFEAKKEFNFLYVVAFIFFLILLFDVFILKKKG